MVKNQVQRPDSASAMAGDEDMLNPKVRQECRYNLFFGCQMFFAGPASQDLHTSPDPQPLLGIDWVGAANSRPIRVDYADLALFRRLVLGYVKESRGHQRPKEQQHMLLAGKPKVGILYLEALFTTGSRIGGQLKYPMKPGVVDVIDGR